MTAEIPTAPICKMIHTTAAAAAICVRQLRRILPLLDVGGASVYVVIKSAIAVLIILISLQCVQSLEKAGPLLERGVVEGSVWTCSLIGTIVVGAAINVALASFVFREIVSDSSSLALEDIFQEFF